MPSFTLYDIDPSFWARVQAKASADGASIKGVILRLLTAWLGVVLIGFTVGCASPATGVGPTSVAPVSDTAPASLSLASTVGTGTRAAETMIRATVRNGHGDALSNVNVSFATRTGSCAPNTNMTGADGIAQTMVTSAAGTTLIVTAGDQTATLVVAPPIPVAPPASGGNTPPYEPTPPPPPHLPPTTPALRLTLTMNVASPAVGQAVTFTAAVASDIAISANLLWQWDDEGDGTLDAQVTGVGPMIRTVRYPTVGPRVLTVRVVDFATGQLAAAAINVMVR